MIGFKKYNIQIFICLATLMLIAMPVYVLFGGTIYDDTTIEGDLTISASSTADGDLSVAGDSTTTGSDTATSYIIGANTLNTNEWAYLDGQDQSTSQSDDVTFNKVHLDTAGTYLSRDVTGNLHLVDDVSGDYTLGNIKTAYDHSQDNTQAHSDYMLNTGDTGTGDYILDGAVTINEAGADKDFRVEGLSQTNLIVTDAANDYVGIGVVPTENFHVYKADATAFKAEVDKTANAFFTGTVLSFTDSNAGTTGFNNFQASATHTAVGGYYTQNQTNFSTTLQLSGSASGMIEARNFLSQVYLKDTTGNYKASKLSSGVFWIYTARDFVANTHTITDINALDARTAYGWGNSIATWNVTNMTGLDIGTDMSGNGATVNVTDMTGVYIRDPFRNGTTPGTRTNVSGIKIDIPTGGTNKYGINLNGDGAGADLVLGAGQDAKVYYNGTDLIIDPNVVGTGKVLIGATGNDTINAGAYEVGGTAGLTGTYTFGGGASGDIASMTFTSGLLTTVTTVP